mmetsp:Transcript_16797/g.36429  ORF Transcript_16797/g.36429 Transcript_16797/m.36429 type:complete len:132 (+) Transcript_16797:47-442(+)
MYMHHQFVSWKIIMFDIKTAVALLALFATAGAADVTGAADENSSNKDGGGTRTAIQRSLRNGNRILTTKRQEDNVDITEDVAFWTRSLQAISFPTTALAAIETNEKKENKEGNRKRREKKRQRKKMQQTGV